MEISVSQFNRLYLHGQLNLSLPLFISLSVAFSLYLSVSLSLYLSLSPPERPSPPRKLSVPQGEVQSRRLRLHWVAGTTGSSPLRYYSLQTRELPTRDWTSHSADIPHNYTAWTVER